MPRFTDEWVVTKSLFEHAAGGSCACCSFPMFDPNGLKGLISAVSDIETDVADEEYKLAQDSPWPPEMRDSIWADRGRLRHKMKNEMDDYSEFMLEVGGEDGLRSWCVDTLGVETLRRMIQMPRSEVTDLMKSKYNILPAYLEVMKAVVEQTANFGVTKYDIDAKGSEEKSFEQMLKFSRQGGFMLDITKQLQTDDGISLEIDNEVLSMLISMIKSLGGPKLLQRGPSSSMDDDNDNIESLTPNEVKRRKKGTPSFKSDRRIARLLIARYWADQIMSKYKAMNKS